jgi:hypothetical protein
MFWVKCVKNSNPQLLFWWVKCFSNRSILRFRHVLFATRSYASLLLRLPYTMQLQSLNVAKVEMFYWREIVLYNLRATPSLIISLTSTDRTRELEEAVNGE